MRIGFDLAFVCFHCGKPLDVEVPPKYDEHTHRYTFCIIPCTCKPNEKKEGSR